MLKKFLKSTIYLSSLAIISVGGAILIHSVLAFTGPTDDPPAGNVTSTDTLQAVTDRGASSDNTITVAGINLNGSAVEGNTTAISQLIGYNDLFLKGNSTETATIYYGASTHKFYTGGTEKFTIAADGTVTVTGKITGLTAPTADSDAVTKAYVDAAGGGGDATLAKQEDILAEVISGDATLLKQDDILTQISSSKDAILSSNNYLWDNRAEFGVQGTPIGTYFSNGGASYFCKKRVVDSNGSVAISNINNGATCANGVSCNNGLCGASSGTLLTWSGSTSSEEDCQVYGGTVYDSGSGTICKITSSSCPGEMSQASNWQKYSQNHFDGDMCDHHEGSAPVTFSNIQATQKQSGQNLGETTYRCWDHPQNWFEPGKQDPYIYDLGSDIINPSIYRIEVGCK